MAIERIVSGGPSGADMAALDFAVAHGAPHGGCCPRGRRAEDGAIDPRYNLQETPSGSCVQRTQWNVLDSDGTVVFSNAAVLAGGSKKTGLRAHKHRKPVLRISRDSSAEPPERELLRFIHDDKINLLNAAGPRASKEPKVAVFVKELLDRVWAAP